MRINFFILFLIILLVNCSFDNKSGIWSGDQISKKEQNLFSEFETITSAQNSFNKIIPIDSNFKFKISKKITTSNWIDTEYDFTNNFKNFKYNNLNKLILKSKKLSNYKLNKNILLHDGNLISSDERGNIIIYSITQKKIIRKFNFYKKKYRKIKKNLFYIIDNEIIYISDNIGYLYSYDYRNNKILWAKNYKIPFRSNLKIFENNLIGANQNNNFYFFDKNTGEILRLIPTEETLVKNAFINSISLNKSSSLFLNTYGSLYAINNQSKTISWFLNLNQSIDLNPSNLFIGNQVINDGKRIVSSSNYFTYVLDNQSGSILFKKNFSSKIKPIILNDYLFLITKNNLLISMDMNDGSIIYSYDINKKIADFLEIKKKSVEFKNLFIADDKIFIFLKNSYLIKLNINGEIEQLTKLPAKIYSNPIFINDSIYYLDDKNKLSIIG